MMKLQFVVICIMLCALARAQDLKLNGEIVTQVITDDGDTLLVADLDGVNITSKRSFDDKDDYFKYVKYRKYANSVYPYAVEAIKVFRKMETETLELKKAKKKKYIRGLKRDLKNQFQDPLKKLTKTQGRILIHMIEKELDTPMYFLLKELRGGLNARWWTTTASLYGYHLRKGYIIGEDPILDMVLDDFDISY